MQTNVALTAGICNIPLTLPAIPHFISDNDKQTIEIESVLSSFNIEKAMNVTANNKTHIWSKHKVKSSIIKQIFRNYRTLKPRLLSDYRYLFWEIDNRNEQSFSEVMHVYKFLELPVYVHKSYRGYHFLSVKPISKGIWNYAIQNLRNTNPRFPPVTLRVLANKYPNELSTYKSGSCYYPKDKVHKDTGYLRDFIEDQDIVSLEHYYMIVFYRLPEQNTLDNMTIEQRNAFQEEQIANSEVNRIET